MIKIDIDVQDTIDEFSLSENQVSNMCSAVSEALTIEIHRNWGEAAKQGLHSTRNNYLKGLIIKKEGVGENSVMLVGQFNNMLENGCEAFDLKCIVNRDTFIFTSKGRVKIKDIKVGDLVLSHRGKFQRVTEVFKEKNEHKFVYKIKPDYSNNDKVEWIFVTPNHPILTNHGWKRADELDQNYDKILTMSNFCSNCGKPMSRQYTDRFEKIFYCSRNCSNQVNNSFRHLNGRTDLGEEALKNIGNKMTETNKKMLVEGRHVTQTGKIQNWIENNAKGNSEWGWGSWSKEEMEIVHKNCHISWGKNNKFSDPESVLWEFIKEIPGIEKQFQFERNVKCVKLKRNRLYYFDFAIPEQKICIEVNGEYWHTEEENELKKQEIESHGWRYISFWSKEVYSNPQVCLEEILRVLDNHNEKYCFLLNKFTVEKIEVGKDIANMFYHKFNLTVENDSSYIANGIVTHNSGFAKSLKVKYDKKGNWYLTIPFRFATPGALGESEVFSGVMPQEIYDIIKDKSPQITSGEGNVIQQGDPLTNSEIPLAFQAPSTRLSITSESIGKVFDTYIAKTNIYEGMIRNQKTYENGSSSTYQTFRRVSAKSDPNSWIHPAISARNFAEQGLDNTQTDVIVDNCVDKILSDYGFGQ